jgi:diacylglycerol kinase (ATP)
VSKGATGIRRLVNALGYSLAGLRGAFQHEDSFRQELLMASILIPAAFFLGETKIEVVLLTASVLIVLIVELVNSALEATVDRISTELHALAKRAKDIGSAAVFLSLINLATIWVLVLFT